MFRICGTGFAGMNATPTVVDYTVRARTRREALAKLKQFGVVVIHYTITSVY